MFRPLQKGKFRYGSLQPHAAHKTVIAMYISEQGLWSLILPVPVPGEVRCFPRPLLPAMGKKRGRLHRPLCVLPFVTVASGKLEGRGLVCWSCRVCRVCGDDNCKGNCEHENIECIVCKQMSHRDDFSCSRWEHRKEKGRRMVCLRCEESNTRHRCMGCQDVVQKEQFSSSMWKHRKERGPTCVQCEASQTDPVHACSVCEEPKAASQYTPSMWHKSAAGGMPKMSGTAVRSRS